MLSNIVLNSHTALVPITRASISFVHASLAKEIDEKLMNTPGFSIDQLMELAGLSVASAANDMFHNLYADNNKAKPNQNELSNIMVYCGPGNNGGDGLVAARHLSHFGYSPVVVYPKRGKTPLFTNLVQQCLDLDIPVVDSLPPSFDLSKTGLIIDALFGFSFEGPSREPFTSMINSFSTSPIPVLSVDIPSGWNVDRGDIFETKFNPAAVISLTTPKLCMKDFTGRHYVGGRFMPPKLAAELNIVLPNYGKGSPNQVDTASKILVNSILLIRGLLQVVLIENPVAFCSNLET